MQDAALKVSADTPPISQEALADLMAQYSKVKFAAKAVKKRYPERLVDGILNHATITEAQLEDQAAINTFCEQVASAAMT